MSLIEPNSNGLQSGTTKESVAKAHQKQGRLKFAVLQYLYAKCGGLHTFLKENGLNNQQQVFSLPTGTPAAQNDNETRIAAYMLTNEGRLKTIKEKKGIFYIVPNFDDELRKEAATLLKDEVEVNGRSCFFQIMKEIKYKVLATNPLF